MSAFKQVVGKSEAQSRSRGVARTSELSVGHSSAASSVSVDIKAFKGKGAIRALVRQISSSVAQVRAEMDDLARQTLRFGAPCYLRLLHEGGRGDLGRARLRWCERGKPRYRPFDTIAEALRDMPPAVRAHFADCEARAQDLNALESVLRQAVDQLESYIKYGTLRQSAVLDAKVPSSVLQQNEDANVRIQQS